MTEPTKTAEQLLEDLAAALDIPERRYASAEKSYQAIGRWLERPESALAKVGTRIYAQGSFRLGTVIRPASDAEDYDLDVVCETDLTKTRLTQHELKELLGKELKAYATAHGMEAPESSRRCWTLNYADEAQFHMDVLPALPDGTRQRHLIEATGHPSEWAQLAVAITDAEHPLYRIRTEDWPASNPKGYAEWFRSRMRVVFDARRRAIALAETRASVEEIPEYRVKTPLQSAIQILKHHRDRRFAEEPEHRPISIILTTLAARAYGQEATISGALLSILQRMDQFIEDRRGVIWIANPTDPRENFADKWADHPERRVAFFDWLETARADFGAAARLVSSDQIVDTLAPRMGRKLVEAAAAKRQPRSLQARIAVATRPISEVLRSIIDAPHRRPLVWPQLTRGSVAIRSATFGRSGFQPRLFVSNGPPLPKHCDLTFQAATDVPSPYQIYWQVVNTGTEARRARGLRGRFEEGQIDRGNLTRHESTLYAGAHSIECFVVKDGYCVARSGPFLVNIH